MESLRSLWPYRFVSLVPEQLVRRREELTQRGQYAQLSALAFFICVCIYTRYTAHTAKRQEKKAPKSWWGSPPVAGWGETRKQYIVVLAFFFWLLALSMWNTGDDYLHLTKSLSHTVVAIIPLQILLSPKLSSRNPFLRLSGIPSQAHLTAYHRLFGRLLIFPLLTLHAVLYLSFFALTTQPVPLLPKRLEDLDVQLGITAILIVFVLWITSSSWKKLGGLRRNLSGKSFYAIHVSLVLGLLAVVYFHVSHARRFVLQGLTIYTVDLVSYGIEKRR